MKVLNFGSLNVDYVYQVDHMTRAGETQQSLGMEVFAGGKGLNQSIALSKAGVPVCHAGLIGEDGQVLLDTCRENGIDPSFVRTVDGKGGHTIIQVDKAAQNCILLYGGSNQKMTREFIDEVMDSFGEGDFLILQNEINLLDYIINTAYEKKMTIVLNPSPYNEKLDLCDFSKVSVFMINEIEGSEISGGQTDPSGILDHMMKLYPSARVVLTLGKEGAYYCDGSKRCYQAVFPVEAVDTTAAGDTFAGYFIYGLLNKLPVEETLKLAACASSIAVSRKGAAASIPRMEEVRNQLYHR
jgi:ribokinase